MTTRRHRKKIARELPPVAQWYPSPGPSSLLWLAQLLNPTTLAEGSPSSLLTVRRFDVGSSADRPSYCFSR